MFCLEDETIVTEMTPGYGDPMAANRIRDDLAIGTAHHVYGVGASLSVDLDADHQFVGTKLASRRVSIYHFGVYDGGERFANDDLRLEAVGGLLCRRKERDDNHCC